MDEEGLLLGLCQLGQEVILAKEAVVAQQNWKIHLIAEQKTAKLCIADDVQESSVLVAVAAKD